MALVLFFGFSIRSWADEFTSLDISVDIDRHGIGRVKEVWDTVDEEGTEKYKPIGNLGKIKIEDFRARVNGRDFGEKKSLGP